MKPLCLLVLVLTALNVIAAQPNPHKIIADSCHAVLADPAATIGATTHARITLAEKYIYTYPDSSKFYLDQLMMDPAALAVIERDTIHQHLLTYSYYNMGVNNYARSLTYAQQVRDLVFQKNIKSDKINILLVISYLYGELSDDRFLESISTLEDFCLPVRDTADANGYVMAKDFLGRYYRHQNQLDTALTILFDLVDTRAFAMATTFHGGVYQSIALYLSSLGDAERSRKWYRTLYAAPTSARHDKVGALLHLARISADLSQYDSTAYYIARADSLGITIQRAQQTRLQLLAALATHEGRYRDALDLLRQSKDVTEGRVNPTDKLVNARLAASAQLGAGNYAQAKEQALFYLTNYRDLKRESKPGIIAKTYYTKLKAEALAKGQRRTAADLDSLWSFQHQWIDKRTSEIGRSLAVKYQTDQVTARNEMLTLQTQSARLTAANRQRLLYLTLALLTAVIAGLYFTSRESRRRQALNEDLAQKNARISLLNADINHRTNGYLGNIVKLLEEQRYKLEDAGADPGVLDELERQTLVYTKLQHLLTTIGDRAVVNLRTYLTELTELLLTSFRGGGTPLQLNLAVDDLNVDPKLAAPLALVLNELLTNTSKYAVRRRGTAAVRFSATREGDDVLLLDYQDDGPAGETAPSVAFSSNSGLDLIEGLTHQMEADRETVPGFGYRARVEL